ncbi:hypothetical protein Tsubulata_037909 [Turnera subulata]|uniref:Uncharacterized protein n=1 Tax=Turnera subulata TaxID=218843 RepID=A0A9Q0JS51_9ROSI|nr:hypothetical protein Tsubulata_037909 [Turnera subulata]
MEAPGRILVPPCRAKLGRMKDSKMEEQHIRNLKWQSQKSIPLTLWKQLKDGIKIGMMTGEKNKGREATKCLIRTHNV